VHLVGPVTRKGNTLYHFQVQAAPYFYVQHIPGNVHESKKAEANTVKLFQSQTAKNLIKTPS
jgi:hypothetical protein